MNKPIINNEPVTSEWKFKAINSWYDPKAAKAYKYIKKYISRKVFQMFIYIWKWFRWLKTDYKAFKKQREDSGVAI